MAYEICFALALGHPFCRFQVLRGNCDELSKRRAQLSLGNAPEFLLMGHRFRFTMSYRIRDAKATGTYQRLRTAAQAISFLLAFQSL